MGLSAVIAVSIILILVARTQWNKKLLDTTEKSNRELLEQLAIVDALSRDFVNVFAIDSGQNQAVSFFHPVIPLIVSARFQFPHHILQGKRFPEPVLILLIYPLPDISVKDHVIGKLLLE